MPPLTARAARIADRANYVWREMQPAGRARSMACPIQRHTVPAVLFHSLRRTSMQLNKLWIAAAAGVFRIDHDEKFNQTTHLQYQWGKTGPWIGFNWRYDSGMVAGAVPFASDATTPVDLSGLSADQQFQAGLFCGSVRATPRRFFARGRGSVLRHGRARQGDERPRWRDRRCRPASTASER